MNIDILTVGKLKENYLKVGIADYVKRLRPYANVSITEVADEKAPESLSEAEVEHVKQLEGERLLKKLPNQAYVIALAIDGRQLSSESFSARLERLATYGHSRFVFLIGGSNGLSEDVLRRADARLSFSRFTFPHQLMRLILLEQIYRAFKIIRNEPYHK